MFKLYSRGCQHALRALTYAVSQSESERFQARDVCEQAGVPEYFTRKVLQALVQGGFLNAHRGPGGGYSLKQAPEDISVLEVIHAVEGAGAYDGCVMGLSECSSEHPCPLHHVWAEAKQNLFERLAATSLKEIANLSNPELALQNENTGNKS